jgi:hypothetical protein
LLCLPFGSIGLIQAHKTKINLLACSIGNPCNPFPVKKIAFHAIFTPETQASEVKTSLSLETKSRKHPGKKGLVKISTAWSTMEIE